jgi:exonuclease SbcC
MRLHSLEIENFRVVRRARLTLPDQVIGIIGPNGAGKSSLVEAVAWALYGNRAARSSKEEIRSSYATGDSDCLVSLEFELGQEHYRLERRLVGRTERPEVVLFRHGSRESAGATETERHVAQLLGLDWRGFRTSFLARQEELNALADLAAGQRREHLAGMLGIDRLDRALQAVKEDRRGFEQKVTILQQQVSQHDLLMAELVRRREHVSGLESHSLTVEGAWQEEKSRLSEAETQYREHQTRQASCSQLEVRREAIRATVQPLSEQLTSLCSRESTLLAAEKELARLEQELVSLDGLRAEWDDLKRRNEKARVRTELSGRLDSLNAELTPSEQKLSSLKKSEADTAVELDSIPADIARQRETAAAKLEDARRRWADRKGELAAEERSLAQLRNQLESIQEVGPEAVCERCLRPFGDDLPAIREHLTNEHALAERACLSLRSSLTGLLEEGEALKREVDDLERRRQRRAELESQVGLLRQQISQLDSQCERLREQKKQIEKQLAALGATEYDSGRLESVSAEINRLEGLREAALGLGGEIKALPGIQASIERLREQLAALESEALQVESDIARVGFDRAAFEQATARLSETQKQHDDAKTAHLNAVMELEIARREIKLKEEELARLEKIGVELEQSRTDQFYAEKLTSLFTEFRKFTISRIRPRLAELSSQLIAEMSGGRYSLVELDEDYNLQVMDNGEYFGIDRFSGGEKDLASLCLRLAISLALTESAGLDRSFVILDEVFGSQDANRRELIFESLANLKSRFPQMILITHLEELKHKVETLIELAPQPGGWSEVRVNGELV